MINAEELRKLSDEYESGALWERLRKEDINNGVEHLLKKCREHVIANGGYEYSIYREVEEEFDYSGRRRPLGWVGKRNEDIVEELKKMGFEASAVRERFLRSDGERSGMPWEIPMIGTLITVRWSGNSK